MTKQKKYGVVYTPKRLADFLIYLLKTEAKKDRYIINNVIDPACGEGALLNSAYQGLGEKNGYYGIDIDKQAIMDLTLTSKSKYKLHCEDAILPSRTITKSFDYWNKILPKISVVIANPPWSSEKIYTKDKLQDYGFEFGKGQYDCYVLFFELAYNLVEDNGYFGFIIPDSIFESQNESLRRFLCEKTEIRVIARLGEKIFDEVNRATTLIICRKVIPNNESTTMCFRLNTDQRRRFLNHQVTLAETYEAEKHEVKQFRFFENDNCNFNIDTKSYEEELLWKIKEEQINWNEVFSFGRGVEISKKGLVVICTECKEAQGYKQSQFKSKQKICSKCKEKIIINDETIKKVIFKQKEENCAKILVGENIHRYGLDEGGYIKLDVNGIKYKASELYESPKLLIRKTGLGIYSTIDYNKSMTSQTVYILKYKDIKNITPLEYYLAILNSRVVYYYYLKVYGENEWKSHPYLTKEIIFSLPIKKYRNNSLSNEISKLAKMLCNKYDYAIDMRIEKLIFELYGINEHEEELIKEELNNLPNLSAINDMKFNGGTDV